MGSGETIPLDFSIEIFFEGYRSTALDKIFQNYSDNFLACRGPKAIEAVTEGDVRSLMVTSSSVIQNATC
jgi:hypothetical protein